MNLKLYILLWGLVSVFLFASCNQNAEPANENVINESSLKTDDSEELKEIFYNMYLPDEMSRLFERVGANFYPDILNQADDFSRYSDDNDIAIAIGVYGVDLSYARLYDQSFIIAKYLTSIQLLSRKIGIPEEYFDDLFNDFEHSISNSDSVTHFASELYQKTDTYLKETGQNSYAALIVMGGWIEALYVASKILEYNSNNIEIMDRIAEQKYSLNSLLSLLSNYQDDIQIAENILLLKRLKRSFDKFDIYYEQENFVLDTINKTISTSGYESSLSPEIVNDINQIISEIRTEIIL